MKRENISGPEPPQGAFGQSPDAAVPEVSRPALEADTEHPFSEKRPEEPGVGDAYRGTEGEGPDTEVLQGVLGFSDLDGQML
jgi:hypothetical protein